MTENNLGNVETGDKVAIVLDDAGRGVGGTCAASVPASPGKLAQPGALPEVENSRDYCARRASGGREFDPELARR